MQYEKIKKGTYLVTKINKIKTIKLNTFPNENYISYSVYPIEFTKETLPPEYEQVKDKNILIEYIGNGFCQIVELDIKLKLDVNLLYDVNINIFEDNLGRKNKLISPVRGQNFEGEDSPNWLYLVREFDYLKDNAPLCLPITFHDFKDSYREYKHISIVTKQLIEDIKKNTLPNIKQITSVLTQLNETSHNLMIEDIKKYASETNKKLSKVYHKKEQNF